jgi:hypothetical protein
MTEKFPDVTFTKMSNGKWGAKVKKGVDKKTGDEVVVSKRDGSTEEGVLGRLVDENTYGDKTYEFVRESNK